jgi:hypothetical protein
MCRMNTFVDARLKSPELARPHFRSRFGRAVFRRGPYCPPTSRSPRVPSLLCRLDRFLDGFPSVADGDLEGIHVDNGNAIQRFG